MRESDFSTGESGDFRSNAGKVTEGANPFLVLLFLGIIFVIVLGGMRYLMPRNEEAPTDAAPQFDQPLIPEDG